MDWRRDRHAGRTLCGTMEAEIGMMPLRVRGHLDFWTFHLQNLERMKSFCFKPSSLWYLIIAEFRNPYIPAHMRELLLLYKFQFNLIPAFWSSGLKWLRNPTTELTLLPDTASSESKPSFLEPSTKSPNRIPNLTESLHNTPFSWDTPQSPRCAFSLLQQTSEPNFICSQVYSWWSFVEALTMWIDITTLKTVQQYLPKLKISMFNDYKIYEGVV